MKEYLADRRSSRRRYASSSSISTSSIATPEDGLESAAVLLSAFEWVLRSALSLENGADDRDFSEAADTFLTASYSLSLLLAEEIVADDPGILVGVELAYGDGVLRISGIAAVCSLGPCRRARVALSSSSLVGGVGTPEDMGVLLSDLCGCLAFRGGVTSIMIGS